MITSASIFFAVLFALIFRSLQLGSYDKMFRDAIESYTGYLQVQHQDFWDEKTVNYSFPYDPQLERAITEDPNVISTVPRFESFALASSGPQTKGVLVLGIDPAKEADLSSISDRKVLYRITPEALEKIRNDPEIPSGVKQLADSFEGSSFTSRARLQLDLGISDREAPGILPVIESYTRFENGTIRTGEPGAWLGDRLSKYLEIGIGDTVILLGQGYRASTAAGKYEVRGIVRMALPDVDNKVVYLPLDICQQLYNAPGNLTSLALHVEDNSDKAIGETMDRIGPMLPEDQRIIGWKEMNEVLVSQLEADNFSGMIMIGILYLVIAFGVFGTVLMLTAERRREFGVLVAIGMQKRRLSAVMSMEMLLIGMLGIIAGIIVAGVVILYGMDHPIVFKGEMAKMFEDYGFDPVMAFEGIGFYFIWQIIIVAIMVLIALMYPVSRIASMKVVNALRA